MFKITSRLRAGEGEGWGEGVGEECVVDLRPTLVHQLVVARGHLTMKVVAWGPQSIEVAAGGGGGGI